MTISNQAQIAEEWKDANLSERERFAVAGAVDRGHLSLYKYRGTYTPGRVKKRNSKWSC